MVINVAVEDEKSTRTIKAVVQTMFDSRNYRLSIVNIGATHYFRLGGKIQNYTVEDRQENEEGYFKICQG